MYPHGRHCCVFKTMYLVLLNYSTDHKGWFPNSTNGPLIALQSLYPDYCPIGTELAGISGDVQAVVGSLQGGKTLDERVTSWRYVPGLRSDDAPHLAVLWEAKPGLYPDGKRNSFGGHAVLLISGDITNVPASDWEKFLKHQEQLGNEVQTKRAGERVL